MRALLLFSVCFICFYSCKSVIEETISAQEYNDKMIAIQKDVDDALVKLIVAIESFDKEAMPIQLDNALTITEEAIETLSEQEESAQFENYEKEIKNLLKVYKSIISVELNEIVEIFLMPDEDYTEEHEQRVYELFDEALTRYSIALANFSDFQVKFADANELELRE